MTSARDIVVAQLKGPLDELDALWDTLGLAHEARVESFDKYTKNFVTVLTNFIAETHEQLSRDQALVDANIKRIEELLFELDEGRLDFDVSLSLAAQIRLSQAKIEELEALFDEREQTILALGEQEQTLLERLGREAVDEDAEPTQSYITALRVTVRTLEKETDQRETAFAPEVTDIRRMFSLLTLEPQDGLETEVVEGTYRLDETTLSRVQALRETLAALVETRQAAIDDGKSEVQRLWTRMRVSQEEQERFLAALPNDLGGTTGDALLAELNRMTQLRDEHMDSAIAGARDEIKAMWEAMYFSEEQTKGCEAYWCEEDNSEGLLDTLELEIARLQEMYSENKALYTLVAERKRCFATLKHLDSAPSAGRFTNRGGSLLQEEKQRRQLAISLPRLNTKILSALDEYEHRNCQTLLIDGTPYRTTLQHEQDTCDLFLRRHAPGSAAAAAAAAAASASLMSTSSASASTSSMRTPHKKQHSLQQTKTPIRATPLRSHTPKAQTNTSSATPQFHPTPKVKQQPPAPLPSSASPHFPHLFSAPSSKPPRHSLLEFKSLETDVDQDLSLRSVGSYTDFCFFRVFLGWDRSRFPLLVLVCA